MIKQQLVLQEGAKLSKPFAIVHTIFSLLSQRCSSRKVRHFIVLQSCFMSLLYLILYVFHLSFSLSRHTKGQNLATSLLPTHLPFLLTDHTHSSYPPDDVEDGWYEELIVDGHSHVTWLMESRGHGADGVAEVHTPQQEQELSWETKMTERSQEWLESQRLLS